MEVVCFGSYVSFPTLFTHAIWVLTSLHLFSFLLKIFFIILVSIVFFLNGVNIFCRLQKYWCKFVYQWRSVFCIYVLIIFLFHSQMMYILYFTYSVVCSPTRSSVSHCVNDSIFQCLSILFYNPYNNNNFYIHYYKNVFGHKCYYYAYDATSTFTFSASMFWVYKCACVIEFHVARLINTLMNIHWKMVFNSRSNLCSSWDCLLL